MYQILPMIAAANLALPDVTLPVEIWSNILRFLDPVSLLAAVRANKFWKNVTLHDPVLRKTIRQQLLLERKKRQEEIFNPGLLITISREGAGKIFGHGNGLKTIRQKPATVVGHVPEGFGKMGPSRRKKSGPRNNPYKSFRC